ncbi:TPA: hypothetical protein DHW58_01815 [Patescibacteria group bacterium]|uniref:Uncharacterized protein n=2 Tax=Bacteria division Kazan-3B-28 TaxID=1798534 RepID=A0A0G1X781_UNCK3|nr:MAG: hypothetical protein VE98_C0001G0189 [candidate division Kazan bacterium GW2011_GWA1_50_15]KKW25535.1 MAG: hypothetical protein VE99_C0001G0172 [candidate division Kazan bacterium GW2011_GWC1_52_13]KKW26841.1 MAG: hypothetical protein VF00_C0002G0166 [candidate division Kazan bacterium GW2011_GWB1_52_7]HAV65834.1 hypothetical protein [Patescibacteria group bacterium]HCL47707.1 hypothetical protein [Patescibacteria group bacterium]
MKDMLWLHLLRKKGQRRNGTAVVVLPGLIPNSTLFDETVQQLTAGGDLWELLYPNRYIDESDLLIGVTQELKQLRYKKVVLVGVSFGGTLAYLLLRHWRRLRVPFQVQGFVAVSAPFDPADVSWAAKLELRLGHGLYRHMRRLFRGVLRVVRLVWLYDWRPDKRAYVHENSFSQMVNGLRMSHVLGRTRFVEIAFQDLPALLLNTVTGVRDNLVSRNNEKSFARLFPAGMIVRGLNEHASLDCLTRPARTTLNRFLAGLAR